MKPYFIGIFGKRNAGKSSIINSLLQQQFSIVSDIPGTTTDPVRKRVELPLTGACTLIDTAGLDDDGLLGNKRVAKSRQVIEQVDLAILVFCDNDFSSYDKQCANELIKNKVPLILVHNKSDISPLENSTKEKLFQLFHTDILEYSCFDSTFEISSRQALLNLIAPILKESSFKEKSIMDSLVNTNDIIVLVCPVDSEAPEGRLIAPQVMAIRDILDHHGIATIVQPEDLALCLDSYSSDDKHGPKSPVKLVVTDSQAFATVSKVVPDYIPLTSFSMLLARTKGLFEEYQKGVVKLSQLNDGDKILILESCMHHPNCEDIGRVKLPALIRKFSGKQLDFEFVSGLAEINNIEHFSMVIQCGGCMVTKRQLFNRLMLAVEKGIPISNYGMSIAYLTGTYNRALKPLLKPGN